MVSNYDPSRQVTLAQLVRGLETVLDASAVTAPRRSQIVIVVLTGFMAVASRE